MSKGKVDHPVWYDGRKFDNVTQASIQLNLSIGAIYTALASGFLKGKEITRTEPNHILLKEKPAKIHRIGEPLIPNPVTCGISTNWK